MEAGQKCIINFKKEHQREIFFSPSENKCLPASTLKPEEREFVVDPGASVHFVSRRDLGDAEMDTLTKSCSLTIVITANGEVQTHEEATVYVKELDIFLTESCGQVGLVLRLHLLFGEVRSVPTNIVEVKGQQELREIEDE